MSRNLSASERSALIRLASSLPKGSPEKRAVLENLRKVAFFVDPRLLPTPRGCSWVEWNRPGEPVEVVLTRGHYGQGKPLGKIVLKTTWQAYVTGLRSPVSSGHRKAQYAAAEVVLKLAEKGIISTEGAEKKLEEYERLRNRPEVDIEKLPTPAGCAWEILKNNEVVLKRGSVILGKIAKALSWQAFVEGDIGTISIGAEEPEEAAEELVEELVYRGVV